MALNRKESKEVLLDRLGGPAALKTAVYDFYGRLLEDVQLAPFFEGVNMVRMKEHQIRFMEIAFSEVPKDMDVAKYIKDKHQHLFGKGLNAHHFDLVVQHLVATLKALDINNDVIDEVIAVIGPLRSSFENEQEAKEGCLLDRLGGPAALKAVVYEFYGRLLQDDELEPFFDGVNMKRMKDHQYKFLEIAFTKIPEDMDVVKFIEDKHKRLFAEGLNGHHFDLVAGHLVRTLAHFEVKQDQIDEVVATLSPLKVAFEGKN
jgi:hemoglobin